jgi:hypothetical protein
MSKQCLAWLCVVKSKFKLIQFNIVLRHFVNKCSLYWGQTLTFYHHYYCNSLEHWSKLSLYKRPSPQVEHPTVSNFWIHLKISARFIQTEIDKKYTKTQTLQLFTIYIKTEVFTKVIKNAKLGGLGRET